MSIDLSQIKAPQVLETVTIKDILKDLISEFEKNIEGKNISSDIKDPNSHTLMIFESIAYQIYHTRAAVNEGARQCMLAYATGENLKNLVALFGEKKESKLVNGKEVFESDESLRRRALLKLDAPSTAGTSQAYSYHAFKVGGSDLSDVLSYTKKEEPWKSFITILGNRNFYESASDGKKLDALFLRVKDCLNSPSIRPLTDFVHVQLAEKIDVTIEAVITISSGVDQEILKREIFKRFEDFKMKSHKIGQSITLSSLHSVFHLNDFKTNGYSLNVLDVQIIADNLTPIQPILISKNQFPLVNLKVKDDKNFEAIRFVTPQGESI